MTEPEDAARQPWQEKVAQIVIGSERQAAMADLGASLRRHLDGLIAAGFSRAEALQLTGGYQTALVLAASQRRGRDS